MDWTDIWNGIFENRAEVLWLVLLTAAAIQDFRTRHIHTLLLGMGLLLRFFILVWGNGTDSVMQTGYLDLLSLLTVWAKAAAVGAAMLMTGRVSRGGIGDGDGMFFLMSALFWDWESLLFLFLWALGISSVWGMVLFMQKRWSEDCKAVQKTIPFLTCCFFPGVWLVAAKIVRIS